MESDLHLLAHILLLLVNFFIAAPLFSLLSRRFSYLPNA